MKINLNFFVISFLFVTSVAFAQSFQDSTKIEFSLDQLNWLSGYWTAEIDGIKMEEFWLPVSNKSMIGIHRDSFQSGKVFFEYLRIEQKGDSIVYFASPKGRTPTEFKLTYLNKNKVVFENPNHDFPQRIIYSLKTDTLIARIEGEVKGDFKFSEWRWIRSKL